MPAIAIYTRLSADPDGKQTSTARQERACREYAALRGWDVVSVFSDVDTSAYNLKTRRPEFERMTAELPSLDGVLVWRLDRLVRRSAEFERFWGRCEEQSTFLASVMEPIDTSSDMGVALLRILVTFAQLESAAKSQRLRLKMAELARTGEPRRGPVPYGYTDEWRRVVPHEARLIREAADRFLVGERWELIAERLNHQGRFTRGGYRWTGEGIRRLVINPRNVSMRVHRGAPYAQGWWPSILNRGTWEKVVARVEEQRRRTVTTRSLLTGWLVCAGCGDRLKNNGQRRYQCMRHTYDPRTQRTRRTCSLNVSALPTEAWVVHHIVWRSQFTARWDSRVLRLVPVPLTPASWASLNDDERRTIIGQHVERIVVSASRPGVRWDPTRLAPTWTSEVPPAPPFVWLERSLARELAASTDRISIPEAAERLDLARDTLYRLVKRGRLTPIGRIGRQWVLSRAEVESLAPSVPPPAERRGRAWYERQ